MRNRKRSEAYKTYQRNYHKIWWDKLAKRLNRKRRGEYIVRTISKSSSGYNAYGITIPAEVVKKYSLFRKRFKLEISTSGKLILYTEVKKKR